MAFRVNCTRLPGAVVGLLSWAVGTALRTVNVTGGEVKTFPWSSVARTLTLKVLGPSLMAGFRAASCVQVSEGLTPVVSP